MSINPLLETAHSVLPDGIDLASPQLYHGDRHHAVFQWLRRHAPLHEQRDHPEYGRFWNLTRYEDIVRVDTDDQAFSAEGGFVLQDDDPAFPLPMFLAMDAPRHAAYRALFKDFFSQAGMDVLREVVRAEVDAVLDDITPGVVFDWVSQVSIALTSRMLARMFDYPIERRDDLIHWSHMATFTHPDGSCMPADGEARRSALIECLQVFMQFRRQREGSGGGRDLLSLLVGSELGRGLRPSEFLGNVLMLIVAGNDTTRNSISAGALLYARHPELFNRLRSEPGASRGLTLEILRLQSPIGYIRRRARVRYAMHGKVIEPGEKVLLWYASGNMDETVFPDPHRIDPDRHNAHKMMSFGFGVHRCLGARFAEMQLELLWEGVRQRFSSLEIVGEPRQVSSTFIKGFAHMPVRVRC